MNESGRKIMNREYEDCAGGAETASLGRRHSASCSPAPHSAYRDAEGWVLFDKSGNVVEDWPAGWPKTVDASFLRTKGVRPVLPRT